MTPSPTPSPTPTTLTLADVGLETLNAGKRVAAEVAAEMSDLVPGDDNSLTGFCS